MPTHRSNDSPSLRSFTFADGRQRRTLQCGAITLRALCAPVSVPSVVNPFPRFRRRGYRRHRAPDVQFGREPARSENMESFKTPLSEEL